MKTLLLISLIATEAFGQKVEVEFDPAANFSQYKTFSLLPGHLNSPNPSLNSELVQKRLDADVQRCLEAKGLTLVSEGGADLHVRYALGARKKVETEAYPTGWRGWGTQVVKVPFAEGTLVIDLRDTKTKSLIWRAISRDEQNDASKIESKLDDMVKKAFDKYPPKQK